MTHSPLNAEQRKLFSSWCTAAMLRIESLGMILWSIKPVAVHDQDDLDTVGCDRSWRVYVNFDHADDHDIWRWSDDLLHVCMHLMLNDHQASVEAAVPDDTRHHKLWNLASDAAVNDDLVALGCSTLADSVTPQALRDLGLTVADHWTPHAYYRALVDNQDDPDVEELTDDVDEEGCGSGAGGAGASWELPADDDMDGQAAPISPQQQELVRYQTATAIQQEAKSRGTVPSSMSDWADKITEPSPVHWRTQLHHKVRSGVQYTRNGSRRDWSHPHRYLNGMRLVGSRGASHGRMVMPSGKRLLPSLAVIVDTSGSMNSRDIGVGLREVETIARQIGVRGDRLMLYEVDAAVARKRPWSVDITTHPVVGRGGTDMRVGIDAALAGDGKIVPNTIVVLTDGETPWPAEPCPVPLVAGIIAPRSQAENLVAALPDHMVGVAIPTDGVSGHN